MTQTIPMMPLLKIFGTPSPIDHQPEKAELLMNQVAFILWKNYGTIIQIFNLHQ